MLLFTLLILFITGSTWDQTFLDWAGIPPSQIFEKHKVQQASDLSKGNLRDRYRQKTNSKPNTDYAPQSERIDTSLKKYDNAKNTRFRQKHMSQVQNIGR